MKYTDLSVHKLSRTLETLIFAMIFLTCAASLLQAQHNLRLEYMGRCGIAGSTDSGYAPLCIASAGDDRLFIARQRGTVEILYPDGTLAPQPFLDITAKCFHSDQRGIMGMCFHPNFRENGLFYMNYTRVGDGAVVIASFRVDSLHPNVCDTSTETILLVIGEPIGDHNGGSLAFGADGYLYIGLGDGGCCGDPGDFARQLNYPLGKILRLDVDHPSQDQAFSIPESNPFATRSDMGNMVWAYGLRNPWRFSFDKLTHDFWIADVGQDKFEELDFQEASSTGGQFYGWSAYEGDSLYNPDRYDSSATYTWPLYTYPHQADWGQCIVGGYVYRGWRFPNFRGWYIFNDFSLGTFFMLNRQDTGLVSERVLLDIKRENRFACIGQDADGELYSADIATGKIYRIVDSSCTSIQLQISVSDTTAPLNGDPLVLHAEPQGGHFSGPGVVDSLFSPALAGLGPHYISYHYTSEDSCGSSISIRVNVTEPTVSVADQWSRPALIYPNPARDILQVLCSAARTARLVDALGQTMREVSLTSGLNVIDIQDLPAGLYTLCSGSTAAQQFVVMH